MNSHPQLMRHRSLSTSVQVSVIPTFQRHIATMSAFVPGGIVGLTQWHRPCPRIQCPRRLASFPVLPAQPTPAPRLRIVHLSVANTNTVIDPAATDRLLAELETISLPPAISKIEQMVEHLADARGLARLGLVDKFGRIGSPALPALLNALESSPNPVVRRSCGKALAKIGDDSATSALLHTLVHDEDTVTRSSAAGALARMGSSSVPRLLDLISKPDVGMTAKGHAAWAIAFMQGEAADELFSQLNSSNKDVRVAVVNALGAVAIGDALPAMAGASTDDWVSSDEFQTEDDASDLRVRKLAISSLSKALDDSSSEVRAEAATALANASCNEEAPRIARLLDDDDVEMRRCAALSLMKLGDTSFVAVLRSKAQSDEVEGVRKVASLAANTLQRLVDRDEDDDWDD